MESEVLNDHVASFEKLQALLKARDDTSRFVGLALLKTFLDNGPLAKDPEGLRLLWESMSPKFLDRLLRSQDKGQVDQAEVRDMVDLAVAVLHTFANLLPEDSKKDKRLIGRTKPLVKALARSPPESTKLILQTLLIIVSQAEGALELLSLEDLTPLTAKAYSNTLCFEILSFAWINASVVENGAEIVQESVNDVVLKVLEASADTEAVTLINFVGELLPRLIPEATPDEPTWLPQLVSIMRKLISSKPTLASRNAYTRLASALLQVYPAETPDLMFTDVVSANTDTKPFSYLFINLLLIDLRSSFPSLLEKLNSADYPSISQRLGSACDILSSFIGFLVRSLDDETATSSFRMPPDLLLKLRKDTAETMSLLIEYLRDRWDASIAGASGLHHSARTANTVTSEGTRRTLTWDTMKDTVSTDPLILAGVRALAIWIREDENDNLRKETAGLMDMFIELYKTSSDETIHFRYPILLALEGVMDTEDGLEGFLAQEGWQTLSQDLQTVVSYASNASKSSKPVTSSHSARGIQIIRVLLAVVDHQDTSFPQEDWMAVVASAASMRAPSNPPEALDLELQIAMLQLSATLLSKSSGGMSKRYITRQPALSGLAKQLHKIAGRMDDGVESADLVSLLDDVLLELDNLAIS